MDYTKIKAGEMNTVLCPMCGRVGKIVNYSNGFHKVVHKSHREQAGRVQGYEVYDEYCEFNDEDFVQCEDCYGTGTVDELMSLTWSGDVVTEERECKWCEGKGWFGRERYEKLKSNAWQRLN